MLKRKKLKYYKREDTMNNKKAFLFFVILFFCISLMATTKNSEYYIGMTIGIVGLIFLIVFIGIVFLSIYRANYCSGKIPFEVNRKIELEISNYLSGKNIFVFKILKIKKNLFQVLYEIFLVDEDEKRKKIENGIIDGSIKKKTTKIINTPFLFSFEFEYDNKCRALSVSVEKNISLPEVDEIFFIQQQDI